MVRIIMVYHWFPIDFLWKNYFFLIFNQFIITDLFALSYVYMKIVPNNLTFNLHIFFYFIFFKGLIASCPSSFFGLPETKKKQNVLHFNLNCNFILTNTMLLYNRTISMHRNERHHSCYCRWSLTLLIFFLFHSYIYILFCISPVSWLIHTNST